MTNTDPKDVVAMRALDVITSASRSNFNNNRRAYESGDVTRHTSSRVTIPWRRYFALVEALEAAYPGVVERTFDLIDEQKGS